MNKIKRILCVLLAGAIAVVSWGCDNQTVKVEPMEIEEVNTLTFDAIGGKDVMPIGAYYGPMDSTYSYEGEKQPNFITGEYFKEIAESGINLLNHSYTDYETQPQNVIKMMELGEKYNMGVFVYDSTVAGPYGDATISVESMSKRVNEYANYPAFCGVYVVDEPQWTQFHPGDGTRTIELYAPVCQNLKELGVNVYANALHAVGSNKKDYFDDYLNAMIEQFELNYLSYDSYVWDKGRSTRDYFWCLSEVRKAAQEHNLPFWVYVQTGSQWNDDFSRFDSEVPYYPNDAQFQWNVNVNLAYGAQGIQYFSLFQPYYFAWAESEPFDFQRNGMFGAWGNKNEWYYYAQVANRQIAAVDEVLMNAKNKGVIVTGKQAIQDNAESNCIMEGDSWRELVGVDGDSMIGCFNYQGKSALYVVNYDWEYAQDITLHFNDKQNVTVIYDGETEHYRAKNLTLPMQAGYGALVVFD